MKTSIGRHGSVAPGSTREVFGIFPAADRPYLLVTLASRRSAAASLRGPSYGRCHVRLGRALLRLGLRTGVAQQFLRDRLTISIEEDAADTTALLDDVVLTEHLAKVFGRRDIALAVRVGRVRPNRKPVVQVLAPDGMVLGYAKIGWNALTRQLIRQEARALADLERRGSSLALFEVPRILHRGVWRELEILILSPLHGRTLGRSRPHIAAAVAAMKEISHLSAGDEMRLVQSDYWRSIRDRVLAVDVGFALGDLAGRVEERYGEEILSFGSWHGDWVPWNMAWRRGKLAVWDWERSGHGVPVGLDAAHFDFQVALAAAHHRPASALDQTLTGDSPLLSSLPLPRKRKRLLLVLHVLEMSVRRAEGRRAGLTPPDATYRPALAELLRQPHEPGLGP
jgi:hypothetical protein